METVDDAGPAGLFRTDARGQRRPAGRAQGGPPDADRGAAQRHPGRARRRSGPDRRRHPHPAVRGARDAADGSRHARGRERRPGLRDDRAARRRRPLPGQAHPDRRPARRHPPRARHDDDDAPGRRLRGAHRRRARPVVGDLLPDLARPRDGRRRGAGGRRHDRAPGTLSVAPTSTSTPRPATGPRPSRRSSTTSSGGPTWTSSRSPTTSGSMPRWPGGRWPSTAGCAPRSSSAKR